MLVDIRNTRGKVVSIEVGQDWMLEDLQKAYNALIGAKKYVHYFIEFPEPIIQASSPVLEQIIPGKTLDAVQVKKIDNPVELTLIVRKQRNEEKVLIYADQNWTILKLKAEICLQMEKENQQVWTKSNVWKKWELKYGSMPLDNDDWTLREYHISDGEISCEAVKKLFDMMVSSIKWIGSFCGNSKASRASVNDAENSGS